MKILFVVTDTGNGNCVAPLVHVIRELEHRGIRYVIVVDTRFAYDYLRMRNVESRLVGSSLFSRFHAFMHTNLFLDKGSIRAIINRILLLERVIKEYEPSVAVVYPQMSWLGKAACLLTKHCGIPSFTFYQSVIDTHPKYGADYVNYFLSYGSQCTEALAHNGISRERIFEIGNPKYDAINSYVKPVGNMLLVATHLIVDGAREWVRTFLEETTNKPYRIVVKPHPDDDVNEYRRLIQETGSRAEISNEPLWDLLRESDLVLVDQSTVGSEAVLFGKPLLVINLTEHQYMVRYDLEGVALLALNRNEILPRIEQALHGLEERAFLEESRERFIERYAYRLDGKSAERFVNAITQRIEVQPIHTNTQPNKVMKEMIVDS